MTKTATKKAKTETAAPIVAGEGYKEVGSGLYAIANIEVDSNFRKTFNEKALPLAIMVAALATKYNEPDLIESITKLGIDAKGVLKEAKAEALRAYKEQQKAGKKAKPAQEDEE